MSGPATPARSLSAFLSRAAAAVLRAGVLLRCVFGHDHRNVIANPASQYPKPKLDVRRNGDVYIVQRCVRCGDERSVYWYNQNAPI